MSQNGIKYKIKNCKFGKIGSKIAWIEKDKSYCLRERRDDILIILFKLNKLYLTQSQLGEGGRMKLRLVSLNSNSPNAECWTLVTCLFQIQMIWILNQFIHNQYIRPKQFGIGKLSPFPSSSRAQLNLFPFYPTIPTPPLLTHQEGYSQLQIT